MERFTEIAAHQHFSAEKLKKNNLFTTDRMCCDVYCLEPQQQQTAHAHGTSDKVYYVIEGRAQIRIDDDEREAAPGTVVLAPAGSVHGVKNSGPGRLTLLVFMTPKPA